jgi:hypothetical protein
MMGCLARAPTPYLIDDRDCSGGESGENEEVSGRACAASSAAERVIFT